jgi:hypothetical protein
MLRGISFDLQASFGVVYINAPRETRAFLPRKCVIVTTVPRTYIFYRMEARNEDGSGSFTSVKRLLLMK